MPANQAITATAFPLRLRLLHYKAARVGNVREAQDMEDVCEFISKLWTSQKGRGIDEGLGDVSILDDAEKENTRKAKILLQPLLRVFDEQALWLTKLHEVLDHHVQ